MLHICCDTCKGSLELEEGKAFAVCQNCGRRIAVPQGYTKEESRFLAASHARQRRDFEEASGVYQEILRTDPENTGALWGSALSRFQVEYWQAGERDYRLVCHRASMGAFLDDPDYKRAVALAPPEEAALYREEGERIQALQERITRQMAQTEPWDVFLCAAPEHPASAQAARRIAGALEEEGYRVFCPAVSLEGVPKEEWEPRIFCGIATAKAMVLMASGKEGFTPGVCFDARRYLTQGKGSLTIAFSQLDEYEDIPELLFDGAGTRLNMDGLGFFDALLDTLEGRDAGDEYWEEAGKTENFAYANLLKSARLELEAGSFEEARKLFDQVLDYNPQEAQAYWGLLLIAKDCGSEEELVETGKLIEDDPLFTSALAFATPREQQAWQQVAKDARERARIFSQQEAERQRREAQAEKDRLAQEARIREAQEQERLRQLTQRKRRKVLTLCAGILLVAGAAAGGVLLFLRWQADSAGSEQYQAAMEAYNNQNYKTAQELFQALGDYKDSQEMYLSSVRRAALGAYRAALNSENRPEAVRTVQSVAEEVPEAQGTLEQWHQEGLDAYAAGEYAKAYELLRGFEEEGPEMLDLRRCLADARLLAFSTGADGHYGAYGIGKEGTLYRAGNVPELPEGQYKSVSLSWGNGSAGGVRMDGTAVLAGAAAGAADVSGWTGCVNIMVSDSGAASLQGDGTLLTTFPVDASLSGVRQADYNNGGLVICYEDGTAWTSIPECQGDVSQWAGLVYVAVGEKQCAGVTAEGRLLLSGTGYKKFPKEDVLSVCFQGSYMAVSTIGNSIRYGTDGDNSCGGGSILAVHSAEVLSASSGGAVEFIFRTAGATEKGDFKKELREWSNIAWPAG